MEKVFFNLGSPDRSVTTVGTKFDFALREDEKEPGIVGYNYSLVWSRADALELQGVETSDRDALIDLVVDWNLRARDPAIAVQLEERRRTQERALYANATMLEVSSFLKNLPL